MDIRFLSKDRLLKYQDIKDWRRKWIVDVFLGCWNYPDTADKGDWTGVFYPDKDTNRLRYYSQFLNTAEMDSSFYNRFYSQITKGTFIGMSRNASEQIVHALNNAATHFVSHHPLLLRHRDYQ
jgi:uncharacterized protein YecE (DUF72 family)